MAMEVPTTSLESSKARLEQLKSIKGRLSRQVGDARKCGESPENLITDLRQVSAEIKKLSKQLKKQLNECQAPEKWTPSAIEIPTAIADKQVRGPVRVEACTDALKSAADAYVDHHAGASIWHRPVISDFIENTYGHRTRYLCALDVNAQVVGVLPIIQLCSRVFGNFLVSMPYFNYGGVLADNRDVANMLINAADQWRQALDSEHLEMRLGRDYGLGLPQKTDKVTFWLPLPDNTEQLWGSFQPKLRSQIRRGQREMTGFAIGGPELLGEFYRVFSENMRDLGTPVYGREFFQNLLNSLKGHAWLVVARIDGQAAGCAFLTSYRGRMEVPWASTLRRYNHSAINMVMYWRMLEYAIQQNCDVFDFGRCSRDAGTYRFKQQWGAQPLKLYWDYVLPQGKSLPALNPDNPRFKLLIAAWQRLPVWVANLIGPHVVKVLP
ncbi:FemAB family XrtA/PEP-CTERM system-associated protein [Marinobacter lipolyticus]|uniref:FemAB family XrtA/PEP-CTERM system-associated protein n=1 Tax=Marinobacter lipolyticus TaxID=209639 RepID=UPI003A9123DC